MRLCHWFAPVAALANVVGLNTLPEPPAPSTIIALTSVVGGLVACNVWVIKYILGQTIPQIHAAQQQQTANLCQTFEKTALADRQAGLEAHRELVVEVRRIGDATEQNQQSLAALLDRSQRPASRA